MQESHGPDALTCQVTLGSSLQVASHAAERAETNLDRIARRDRHHGAERARQDDLAGLQALAARSHGSCQPVRRTQRMPPTNATSASTLGCIRRCIGMFARSRSSMSSNSTRSPADRRRAAAARCASADRCAATSATSIRVRHGWSCSTSGRRSCLRFLSRCERARPETSETWASRSMSARWSPASTSAGSRRTRRIHSCGEHARDRTRHDHQCKRCAPMTANGELLEGGRINELGGADGLGHAASERYSVQGQPDQSTQSLSSAWRRSASPCDIAVS